MRASLIGFLGDFELAEGIRNESLDDEAKSLRFWAHTAGSGSAVRSAGCYRVAFLGALAVAVLALVGCGEDSSSDQGGSKPAATATSDVRSEYYRAMDKLAVRLDRAVSGAIDGDATALARIENVLRQIRTQLAQYRTESPGGQFLLTTAASARDYARSGNRQGLRLIRRVPLIEARDALKSEATG